MATHTQQQSGTPAAREMLRSRVYSSKMGKNQLDDWLQLILYQWSQEDLRSWAHSHWLFGLSAVLLLRTLVNTQLSFCSPDPCGNSPTITLALCLILLWSKFLFKTRMAAKWANGLEKSTYVCAGWAFALAPACFATGHRLQHTNLESKFPCSHACRTTAASRKSGKSYL